MSITGLDQEIEMIIITCTTIMDVHEKQNFIVFVHTSAECVKPAQPAGPIFFTSTLLMGGLSGDADKAG